MIELVKNCDKEVREITIKALELYGRLLETVAEDYKTSHKVLKIIEDLKTNRL